MRGLSACPQCGQENRGEARFCVKCGASLGAPSQAVAQPPAAAAPPPAQQPARWRHGRIRLKAAVVWRESAGDVRIA
ncbi:MAG: zinc-ribbon domain-containing protein [Actinobacteria bacterium]|nr:MAG: zinc-ribbon domain-containing protein [Actinomycetota bacterium]